MIEEKAAGGGLRVSGDTHVVTDELEARMAQPLTYVGLGSGEEIVHTDDLVVLVLHELVDKMRTDEAASARHQDAIRIALDGPCIVGDLRVGR